MTDRSLTDLEAENLALMRELEDIRDRTGIWTLRFLLITLAVTPLRRLLGSILSSARPSPPRMASRCRPRASLALA